MEPTRGADDRVSVLLSTMLECPCPVAITPRHKRQPCARWVHPRLGSGRARFPFDLRTQEAQAGRSLQVPGQPKLPSETPPENRTNNEQPRFFASFLFSPWQAPSSLSHVSQVLEVRRELDSLELEIQVAVGSLWWVLGPKLKSSGKARCTHLCSPWLLFCFGGTGFIHQVSLEKPN